jgi:hypothetical protein
MQYTITPDFNQNEQRAKYLVDIVFDDDEIGHFERYVDEMPTDLTEVQDALRVSALNAAIAHEDEVVAEADAEAAKQAALAALPITQPIIVDVKPEDVSAQKEANILVAQQAQVEL